jgi:hypothetical protein
MNTKTKVLVLIAVAAVIGAAVMWRSRLTPPPEVALPAPPVAVPAEPVASEPTVRYPVEADASLPPLTAGEIAQALVDLLGRTSVSSFLQTDDFPRRFTATVDNLGRSHAPPMLWPVTPTPGRFTVEDVDGSTVIAKDNSARYTPFVLLVETVDIGRMAKLYARMYPLLQRAYEELGFPRRHFNDRLIEVIDLLQATPDAEYPLRVQLVDVKGPIASVRPWVRYEFADPELESLAAGQKILLRTGPVNQRRLKAKLAEIREALTKSPPVR